MNLLRAALAGIAEGGRPFFSSVILSGSHRCSAELVVNGQADVAAIDCVTLAHLRRLYPTISSGLRVLCWTPASPSLPFITAASTDEATLRVLRASFAAVLSDTGASLSAARATLLLDGLNLQPDPELSEVRRLTRQAAALGLEAVLPGTAT
jgi:ABC-type phosphate/phosphonate transport system substrate-binding protein